jgi:peptidoglycan/LPS O-acetylase OafA/YrhL
MRKPEIDGVRGIAILLVVVWHYIACTVQPGTPFTGVVPYLALTWSGVDLFFVLSGFLIGGILMDNREAKNFFFVFYIRRACRIIPLYAVWLLIFFALVRVATPVGDLAVLIANPLPLWSYATFTQNIMMPVTGSFGSTWLAVTWSLAVEEQFYLVLPLVIRYASPRIIPWICIACILCAPLLRLLFTFFIPNGAFAAYVLLPCRADSLMLGVISAWMIRQPRILSLLAANILALYCLLAILIVGSAVMTVRANPLFGAGWLSLGYTWIALMYACFLLIAVTEKQGVIKMITTLPPLVRLGLIAYGVYILHLAVLAIVHWAIFRQVPRIVDAPDIVVTIAALILTVALARLSLRTLENPFVNWGHRFRYSSLVSSALVLSSLRRYGDRQGISP